MLVWSAEHVTETTVEHVELELTPNTTNVERCVPNVEFVLQQMHAAVMALTIYEATALIEETISTRGGRKQHFLRTVLSLGKCSLLELQAGIGRWESHVSRYETKLKDTLGDEIKLAGMEELVLEELKQHFKLNSKRLRTFAEPRLEIVTYVEAKFGLRISDSKPIESSCRTL